MIVLSLTPAALLFWLLVAHAVADFPLQGDFLARAKNHRNPVVAANGQAFPWWIALGSHALIHAGAVALLTGSLLLGLAELLFHAGIDYATSEEAHSYLSDQMLHVACKISWATVYAGWM